MDNLNYLKTLDIAGRPLQTVHTQTGAVATGTTIMPNDDTIPQNTEGDEYMTLAVTPTSTTNKLIIDVVFLGAHTTTALITLALFQDTTASALAATGMLEPSVNNQIEIFLRHEMVAGTISATTFKARAGGSGAGTLTFNGVSSARKYGGVAASSIRITEIKV